MDKLLVDKSQLSQKQKIDISLLQTFHLVAKTRSFSAAARELNISYQSAANHVRRLEQIYGTQLVKAEKGSREISLTAPGRALHTSLKSELDTILSRISLLMRDVHSMIALWGAAGAVPSFFPRDRSASQADTSRYRVDLFRTRYGAGRDDDKR